MKTGVTEAPLLPAPGQSAEPVVYMSTHAVPSFVDLILPTIRRPFRLVTGDCDLDIPVQEVQKYVDTLLENDYLVVWFAQNCVRPGGKLQQMPIGLDYHSVEMGNYVFAKDKQTAIAQEKDLLQIRNAANPFWERNLKCYSNFHHALDLVDPPAYLSERRDAKGGIQSDCIEFADKCPRIECWKRMAEFAFIPSPAGNGLDCHRTWEALNLGCIAIVKASPIDPLFDLLPVWIVQDWKDVTLDNMQKVLDDFKTRFDTFEFERLRLDYWINRIRSVVPSDHVSSSATKVADLNI
jgi:hypothetical protein